MHEWVCTLLVTCGTQQVERRWLCRHVHLVANFLVTSSATHAAGQASVWACQQHSAASIWLSRRL
jgi:hypothetical protein